MIEVGAGWGRLVRVAALASLATLVAAFAHTLGGGHDAPPGLLLTLAAATTLIAVPLTRRRLRAPQVALLLSLDQLAVHLAMARMPSATEHGAPGGAMSGTHPGHLAPALGALPSGGGHELSWQMLAAHTLAAIVLGVLWARGEQVLWRVVRALTPPAPARVLGVVETRTTAAPRLAPPRLTVVVLPPPRGPPIGLATST